MIFLDQVPFFSVLCAPRLPPLMPHQVLVNDGLDEAYAELKETAKAWYPQLAEDEAEKNKNKEAETLAEA